jgi:hypothetical protein
MAASYASQKLNATAGALKAGQQPQSIQGMINSQNPVSLSGQYDNGYYHSFTGSLPGQDNPTQFDRTIRRTNMVNANHVPMDTFSKTYDPNKLADGAQKIHQAITDNAFRTGTPVDFFSGNAPRASGTGQHPLGQAIDVRLRDPLTGDFVGTPQIGALAANPIGNVKPLMGRSPKVANAIQDAIEQPYRNFAKGVINSFMDNPGVYGAFENQRWGGAFNGPWGKDYMHYDEGKVTPGVSAEQAALRKDAMNYSSPVSGGTQFAGTSGSPIQNAFTGSPPAPDQSRFAAVAGPPTPAMQSIPSPTSTGMLPGQPQQARPMVAGDPRVSMQPGSYPAATPTMAASNPFGAVNPVAAGRLASLQTRMAVDDAMSVSPPVPTARPPSQNMQRPSGTTVASTDPESYSPQVAPGDQVAGDAPEVFSENPMQGSQNPMQEGENPQVKRDRQQKYASRGATIGGIVAGPLGTVVGGTLGWQMGKTPPRQRQAIASNPQALTANVKSINDMVEERGGKGNPQMQVTEAGFRDVLTNPAKVTKEPEKYTTLEQMLAALAQGVDPETGKPIT